MRSFQRDHIYCGDALEVLRSFPEASIDCCVTSPPYWGLRNYGVSGQIGLEKTPTAYVDVLVNVFREVRRVLRNNGTLWLNIGDSYTSGNRRTRDPGKSKIHEPYKGGNYGDGIRAPTPKGLKPKDLVGIPWHVAFALQADGWYLRSDIVWAKPNPVPESVKDRPTRSHEYIFLLSKSKKYYYDRVAVLEPCQSGPSDIKKMLEGKPRIGGKAKRNPDRMHAANFYSKVGRLRSVGTPFGRNRRDVWFVATQPFKGAHFAVFPEKLIVPCVLAGCPVLGLVLDPFFGSGTVGVIARTHERHFVGIELNPEYVELASRRISACRKK